MTYFFILGNNPTLSIAEIVAVSSFRYKVEHISKDVLLINTDKELDVKALQKQLGGTIKIGKIINTRNIYDIKKVQKSLIELMVKLLPCNVSKVYFGFSVYGRKLNIRTFERTLKFEGGDIYIQTLKQLALAVKKKLKQQGTSSRWVVSKEKVLSSVIVQKNKLLTQGAEFILFIKKSQAWIGKTLVCQEFEQYSFYDFSRPYRAIEKGMIPPKLAKIMINLSRVDKKSVLLDPFCGSGTIIQQALLMEYAKVIGSDIDNNAIVRTNENLKWLSKKLNRSFNNVDIFQSDIKDIFKKVKPDSIDVIITEPYLGPLRVKSLKLEIKNLSDLYISAFKSFKKVLKSGGRVIIIFPVFKTRKELHLLPVLNEIKDLGWRQEMPLPQYLLKNSVINITDRNSIIYSRPDQKILREVLIFIL